MIHPLIIGNLQATPTRLLKSGLIISIEIGVLLTQIAVLHSTPADPSQANIAHWLSNLLEIVFWISFLIAILAKYVDVTERSRDFGILHILGASTTYLAAFLLQETILEAIPGAILGLLFSYILGGLFKVLLTGTLAIPFAYPWWPAVTAIAIGATFTGAILAIPRAIREGAAEAL